MKVITSKRKGKEVHETKDATVSFINKKNKLKKFKIFINLVDGAIDEWDGRTYRDRQRLDNLSFDDAARFFRELKTIFEY